MKPSVKPAKRLMDERAYRKACHLLSGGVNSPVRAYQAVGGTPRFIQAGGGAHVQGLDGRWYLDYVGSWGPLILGHAAPTVVAAVLEAATRGLSYGSPTMAETRLAGLIADAFPSIDRVRLVCSGTEAVMSALRVARAATQRDLVVKFEGGYHGHADAMLVAAGSGATTLGVPSSPGVPRALAKLTATLPYNDAGAARRFFQRHGRRVAALIVEPVAGNMGVVPPKPGFLETLRRVTRQWDACLIFDEVITGFRLEWGGAQTRYGVKPDLTTLGKIIGGGMPVGAYGGRRDLMDLVSPAGPVYQAGTLAGNPVATAAGIATLEALRKPGVYRTIDRLADVLEKGLLRAAHEAGCPLTINRVGSMLTAFCTDKPVTDYATALRSDTKRYAAFFHGMAERGILFAPAQYEAAFVSAAHRKSDIDHTVEAAREVFKTLR